MAAPCSHESAFRLTGYPQAATANEELARDQSLQIFLTME